jgi:hypothetical protein
MTVWRAWHGSRNRFECSFSKRTMNRGWFTSYSPRGGTDNRWTRTPSFAEAREPAARVVKRGRNVYRDEANSIRGNSGKTLIRAPKWERER